MGTDINIAIERFDRAANVWRQDGVLEVGRNRHVFALLAFGDTDSDLEPIAASRGLPSDLSENCCTCDDGPNGLGHTDDSDEFGWSCSWVTLDELVAVDWTKPIRQYASIPLRAWDTRGFRVVGETYEEWRRSAPHAPRYSDDGTGTNRLCLDLTTIAEDEYRRERRRVDLRIAEHLISHPEEPPEPMDPPPGAIYRDQTDGKYGWERGKKYPRIAYATVDWLEPLHECAALLYQWVMEKIKTTDDGAHVRLVFGFS